MKTKGIVTLILASCLFLSILTADIHAQPLGRHLFLNFSIFYPLSINQSKYDSTNINLTLFYGRVGQVRGLDMALGVTVVEEDVRGLQVAGLAGTCGSDFVGGQIAGLAAVSGNSHSGFQLSGLTNVCGDEFLGFQGTGLINVTGSYFRGIQAAGIFNIAGEEMKGMQAVGLMNIAGSSLRGIQVAGGWNIAGESAVGMQASGLFNVTGESFNGLQASGIFSVTGEDHTGVQLGGIFNVAGGWCKGVQVGGIFNVAGENLSGLQVGITNAAGASTGFQVGLFNAAGNMDGVQIGIVNYSRNTTGLPVGLVNISKNDGRISWISWTGNLMAVNSGIKFSIKKTYSIVALGGINIYGDLNECLSYSGFYGFSFPVNVFTINTDIGYMYMDNATIFRSQRGNTDQHVFMLRASLNSRLSDKLALFAGGGLSSIRDRGAPAGTSDFHPIFFAGVELF